MNKNTLLHTLTNSCKFTTFSLIVTMLERCIRMLLDYGISDRTISFLNAGLEIQKGYLLMKDKEDFDNLIKNL